MMGELWHLLWGALRLQRPAVERWHERRDVLARGLGLLVVVSLLSGAAQAWAWGRGRCPPGALQAASQSSLDSLEGYLSRSPLSADAQHLALRGLAWWLDLRTGLAALPRPLGWRASCLLQGLGVLAAAPYQRLASWLVYSLLVFGLAKALGGRASLQGMLGTSALYAAPHLLDVLRPLPGWGLFFGAVAAVWGWAIYVRATAVANELDMPRTLVAALLPALVAVTVVLGLLAVAVGT